MVNGDQSHSLDHRQDSGEQHTAEEANTLSVGLDAASTRSCDSRSTLLESFGYSEDSNSNTIALLKTVSASNMLYIDLMFLDLI